MVFLLRNQIKRLNAKFHVIYICIETQVTPTIIHELRCADAIVNCFIVVAGIIQINLTVINWLYKNISLSIGSVGHICIAVCSSWNDYNCV